MVRMAVVQTRNGNFLIDLYCMHIHIYMYIHCMYTYMYILYLGPEPEESGELNAALVNLSIQLQQRAQSGRL